jgi:hypothetical protein
MRQRNSNSTSHHKQAYDWASVNIWISIIKASASLEIVSIVDDMVIVRDDRDGFKLKLPTKLNGGPNPFLKTIVVRQTGASHG